MRAGAARYSALVLCLLTLSSCGGQLPLVDVPNALPGQEKAVVFDIDGTLTPRVFAVSKVRADAAEAANVLAGKGYEIIYLSARVKWLTAAIPGWLKANGFPEGTIHVAQTGQDRRDPATFKAGVLIDYGEHGWSVDYAYGDSSSDFEAYAAAGIPEDHVFALRREGAGSCEPGVWNACLNGWTEHLDYLRQSVPPLRAN